MIVLQEKKNYYIEYKSKGNLSPEEYLKMIRQYLRELIKNHNLLWN